MFDLSVKKKNAINFSIGQPDFGPSPQVKEATIKAIREGKSGYSPTEGILPLRQKISQKLKLENNINKDAEEIIVTPGTSAGIFLSLAAILDPDDEVIIPDPYFVEYPELVKFLDAKAHFLSTYPDFQIDPQNLKKLITKKTKAVILNSPNNPTGAVYPKELLQQIAQVAKEHNLIIISDEIYEKFIYDGMKHFSIGSVYPQTITIGGLSKSGGMPGWRLAWATGPGEIIEKMKQLQQYTFVSAPTLVQYGAIAAFAPSTTIKDYQERRDIIFNLLSKRFNIVKPKGAFYIMVEVGDADKFAEWALSKNVLLIPGSTFSQKNTHARLSYAVSKEDLEKGATILTKYA